MSGNNETESVIAIIICVFFNRFRGSLHFLFIAKFETIVTTRQPVSISQTRWDLNDLCVLLILLQPFK